MADAYFALLACIGALMQLRHLSSYGTLLDVFLDEDASPTMATDETPLHCASRNRRSGLRPYNDIYRCSLNHSCIALVSLYSSNNVLWINTSLDIHWRQSASSNLTDLHVDKSILGEIADIVFSVWQHYNLGFRQTALSSAHYCNGTCQ